MLAAAGWIAAGPTAALAQTKPAVTSLGPDFPKTEIFIGNSFFYYNNGMPGQSPCWKRAADPDHKKGLSRDDGDDRRLGLRLARRRELFPAQRHRLLFVSRRQNNVIFNKLDKLFDVAVMMDCSQCPIHPRLKTVFTEFAKKNSDIVRAHGAKPVFFMSWAYADKPEMTAQLAEAYTVAGNENNALVIPAGLAFARAIGKQPELNLHAPDKRHPSPAGTYLGVHGVCRADRPLAGRQSYLAGIDEPTARFLQTVAWETVQDYFWGRNFLAPGFPFGASRESK